MATKGERDRDMEAERGKYKEVRWKERKSDAGKKKKGDKGIWNANHLQGA